MVWHDWQLYGFINDGVVTNTFMELEKKKILLKTVFGIWHWSEYTRYKIIYLFVFKYKMREVQSDTVSHFAGQAISFRINPQTCCTM